MGIYEDTAIDIGTYCNICGLNKYNKKKIFCSWCEIHGSDSGNNDEK